MALMGLFAFTAIVQRIISKGPMLWPVLGIIPTLFFHLHNPYDWITEALNSCGGTFHYRGMWMGGSCGLVTMDPCNVEYMLKIRFKNFPKGRYYRERFSDLLGDGIFNADGEIWKEQRRVAVLEMHSTRFIDYSVKTKEELVHKKLLKLLEKLAMDEGRIDLQDLLLRFTFDNICAAAFGLDPGCLAIDLLDEVQFAKAFEEATALTLFRFLVPPFVWKAMKLLEIGPEKRLKEAVRVVHEFAAKTIAERRVEYQKFGGLGDRSDLLSRLIDPQDIHEKSMNINYRYSDRFLKDFCISFILAGRDTSSVALAWFFWLLYKHPHVEKRILSEIEEIIRNREIKDSSKEPKCDIKFTVDELKKMDYLQAALSESLRLYPSVPTDFKEAVEDDVLPDGTPVKKGDRVIYSIFSMARSDAIWGKDCMEFKPERWNRDGRCASENEFKYPVFNAGPRLCVGKRFAYMQMKMVAASILFRYSVSVVEGHVVVPKVTTTLYMKNGLLVTFNPRISLSSPFAVSSAS